MITYIIIGLTALISVVAFSDRALFAKLLLNPYQVYHRKEYFRLITHGFIHADWNHLIFNMLSLYFFGGLVEHELGIILYMVLYLGGLIFASLGSIIKYKDNYLYNSVGASGAVSSVVFASILFYPWNKIYIFFIPIGIPGILFGVIFLWYSHYMSKKNTDNINHEAHMLGALFGLTLPIIIDHRYFLHFINELINFF